MTLKLPILFIRFVIQSMITIFRVMTTGSLINTKDDL